MDITDEVVVGEDVACAVVGDGESVFFKCVFCERNSVAFPDFDAFAAVLVQVVSEDGGGVGVPDVLADGAVADGVVGEGDGVGGDAHAVAAAVDMVVADRVSSVVFDGDPSSFAIC